MAKEVKKAKKKVAVPEAEKKATKGFPPKKDGKAKGKAKKKKALPTFKAPEGFKPFFLLFQFKTEADGLIATQVKGTRFQGRFDREADDKKKFDLASYDAATLMGVAARIAGVTYKATNDKKFPSTPKERKDFKGSARLPAKAVFQALIRVGKKSADQTLTASVKQVWQAVQKESGQVKLVELEKTDVCYRAIRKSSRFLPAAFVNVQVPPKRTRGRKGEEDEE